MFRTANPDTAKQFEAIPPQTKAIPIHSVAYPNQKYMNAKRTDSKYSRLLTRLSAALGLAALLAMRPAEAAPPTVVPSPGYDARLREERSVRIAPPPAIALPTPLLRPRPQQHRHHRPRRAIDGGSY